MPLTELELGPHFHPDPLSESVANFSFVSLCFPPPTLRPDEMVCNVAFPRTKGPFFRSLA